MNNEQQRDPELWEMAKARATFKWTLLAYTISNTMLIFVWYFYSKSDHFWPIWPILGWGIAIAFQYYSAYHGNGEISVRREYEKIKAEQQK